MLPSECVIKEVFANTQLYRMIICKLCTYRSLHCPKVSKKKMKVEESKLVTCYVFLRLLLAFSGAHNRILNSDNIFLAKCSLGVHSCPLVLCFYVYRAPCTFDLLSQNIFVSLTCCSSFAPIIQQVSLQVSCPSKHHYTVCITLHFSSCGGE